MNSSEKDIIRGEKSSVAPLIWMIIIGVIILICSFSGLFGGTTYFDNKGNEIGFTPHIFPIVLGFILIAFGVLLWIYIKTSCIIITNVRVFCSVFGIAMVIPVNSITSIGTIPLCGAIVVGSSSAKLILFFIRNSKYVFSELSKLILNNEIRDKEISNTNNGEK